jgi:two-component system NtrC family sensor kinase
VSSTIVGPILADKYECSKSVSDRFGRELKIEEKFVSQERKKSTMHQYPGTGEWDGITPQIAQTTRQTVLIVDDDSKIREVTCIILEGENYQVHAASNGKDALESLVKFNIDLVLLDILLPDVDGYTLCKTIKSNESTKEIPVILLTSLDGVDNKVRGLDVGANDYLVKPFLHKELLARIRSQLREREFTREARSLYSVEKRRTHELLVLNKLTEKFNQSLDPQELLLNAAREISNGLKYRSCVIALRDGEAGLFQVRACYHAVQQNDLQCQDLKMDRKYLDRIALERKAVISAAGDAVKMTFQFFPESRSQMLVPLVSHNWVEGILVVEDNLPDSYSNDDLNLLSTVAGNLALALKNAELFRRAQLHSENLQQLVAQRTREIEKQKKLMECIIDSLPLGLYVIDEAYDVVTWNRKRETGILGIPREQVVGRNLFSVFPSLIQDKLKSEFERVLATAEPFETETVSYVSGEKRHYHIRKIPMEMEVGHTSHVITLAEDISDRKRLEESVYTNGKLASLGRLSAGIAHELNNPMAAIAGCVEGLISRAQAPELSVASAFEDFPEYLKIIDDEIQRCKGIINNLLDFSRSREMLQQPVQVNEILEQTLQLLSHHKSFKSVQVLKELDSKLPAVVGNSGELRQVFVAMAINAMDAMDQSGSLTIRSLTEKRHDQDYICIHFQDTGVGIPPANLTKIFDPFFTTKEVGQGVGLGLSICYGIIRSHNGFIKVTSEEGKGTLFQIYIPVNPVREPVS